jgi:hypothetical protein
MSTPRGRQRPHHLAEIVLPILALAAVAWATVVAWIQVGRLLGG